MWTLFFLFFYSLGCTQPGSHFPSQREMLPPQRGGQDYPIVLHIIVDEEVPYREYTANFQRNGVKTTVPCKDRGDSDYDQPDDGVYVCISQGGYSKYVNVHISAVTEQRKVDNLYSGLIRTDDRSQDSFYFHLTRGVNHYMLIRTAGSSNESSFARNDQAWRFIVLVWTIMIFLFFGALWKNKE
jgi:hypothetical protein